MSEERLEQEEMAAPEQTETLAAVAQELGLTQEQAAQLLRATVEAAQLQRERAERILDAIDSIADPAFTVQSLRANEEAMRALEKGMSVGAIYRRYFVQPSLPQGEMDANLGARDRVALPMSREEIERISEYVDRTGRNYQV